VSWAEKTLPFTFTFTNYAPGFREQGTDTTSSIEADYATDSPRKAADPVVMEGDRH
jgi:hypothetical protein